MSGFYYGGVVRSSSETDKNLIPFRFEKVGTRRYKITLSVLGKGEYGFLPSVPLMRGGTLGSIGKIYTFGVVE